MLSILPTASQHASIPPEQSRQPRPVTQSTHSTTPILAPSSSPATHQQPHTGTNTRSKLPPRHSSLLRSRCKGKAGSMSRTSRPPMPPSRTPRSTAPAVRREDDWRSRPELRLKIFGLPHDITTHAIWACFARHGTLSQIEILEDSRGLREGTAMVTFR